MLPPKFDLSWAATPRQLNPHVINHVSSQENKWFPTSPWRLEIRIAGMGTGRRQGRYYVMEEQVSNLLQKPHKSRSTQESDRLQKRSTEGDNLCQQCAADMNPGNTFCIGCCWKVLAAVIPPSKSSQVHGNNDLVAVCAVTRNILNND